MLKRPKVPKESINFVIEERKKKKVQYNVYLYVIEEKNT